MKTQALLEQAQLLTDNENYDKAYEILKTAYEADQTNPEILEKIALSAQILNKEDEVLKYWEELSVVDPSSIVALTELQDRYLHTNKYKYYLTRAKVKVLSNQITQAISDYKKAIDNTQEESEIVEARFLLAKSYEFVHKTQNAIDEYYRILDHKEDVGIYYKLAELCAENDKYAAIDVLNRALEVFPSETDFNELLAKYYLETEQLDKALKHTSSELKKAKILLMQGNNDKAFEILETLENKNSKDYLLLVAEYYFNKSEFDKCEEEIDKFSQLDPQSPLTYQMKALIEEEKGNSFKSHYNWAICYEMKKDYEMAQSEYLIAHNIEPKNAETINALIKLIENHGEKHSLVEFYEKILALEPDNKHALEKLGDFYFDLYEFRNAIDYYEKIEELGKAGYKVLLNIGKSYEKLKSQGLAKEYYQKYLKKAPSSPEAAALKARLDSIPDENNMPEDDGLLEKLFSFFKR